MPDTSADVAEALLEDDKEKGLAYLKHKLPKGPSSGLLALMVQMLKDGRLTYNRKRRGRPSKLDPMRIAEFYQQLRADGEKADYANFMTAQKFKITVSTVKAIVSFTKEYDALIDGIQAENHP